MGMDTHPREATLSERFCPSSEKESSLKEMNLLCSEGTVRAENKHDVILVIFLTKLAENVSGMSTPFEYDLPEGLDV